MGRVLSGRAAGVTLSSTGEAQAARLAETLANRPLHAILSSPLERAKQTALAVGRQRGLGVLECDALVEINFGEWTRKTFAELERDPHWKRFNEARGFVAPPAGESFPSVQERVLTLMRSLANERPDQTIALVSHADVIKAALLGILGAPAQSIHQLEISPASVSTVEWGEWMPRVAAINWVG
ncbi:MAG: histidine phosphatase family protein [Bryobacterales bacterium]|nr:histidine phosphatase family protein [Bryobacterales bacterium]